MAKSANIAAIKVMILTPKYILCNMNKIQLKINKMKYNNFKPRQKLINLNEIVLHVHHQAEDALTLWQRFRSRNNQVDFFGLDKFYQPPLRLIKGEGSTLYFVNDFARVDNILISSSSDKYPCLITPESIQDIQMLAWAEVVKLVFSKDIHHPQLFKALKQMAPKYIICKLMGINSLMIDSYCSFAGITKTSFEYQQSKIAVEDGLVGLPMSMDWLVS
mgnify:CR=1 FL=1